MTSLREHWNHWFHGGEQKRSRNMERQKITLYKHGSYTDVAQWVAITTRPPFNDPAWKWGIDIAGVWDGVINAQAFSDAHGSFVIVKAADGTLTGKFLAEIVAALEAEGVPYAFYDWLYPDWAVSTKAQGQKWAALANMYHPCACFIDLEWTSFMSRPANPEESDLLSAVSWLRQGWAGPVGVYSAPGYLLDHPLSERCRDLLWWIAQYGVLFPSSVYPFGAGFTLWQQSDRWGPADEWGIDPNWAHVTDGDVMTPAAFYSLFTGSDPPPPDPSDVVTHPWEGVTVTSGRRFGSDFRMIAVAQTSIADERITPPGMAHIAENIPGDIVTNGGDFNMTTYAAVGLLRAAGREYAPQADSEPAIAFDGAGNAWLDHRIESWWSEALGLKRYIVLDGAQAPNTSDAWANAEPRTIYGLRSDGTRLILQCKGRATDQAGLTLYQAAAVMIEFGAERAGDGDGGDSVQGRVGDAVFVGTGSRRLVADFYAIQILTGGAMTKIIQGTVVGDTVKIRLGYLGTDTGKYLRKGDTIEASENNAQWLHLSKWNDLDVSANGWWASAGSTQQYISWKWVDVTPPPPPPPPPADETIAVSNTLELVDNATGARYRGTLTGTLTKVP